MAKILFISDNFLNESLGIMYLSAYLKANDHAVELTLLQDYKKLDDLISFIEDYNPDLVGFSVMTPQVTQFRPVTQLIKERTDRTIIWGGSHCMFMQEEVMNYPGVDIICVGDGEEAVLELMNRIESGKDYSGVPSLYVKTKNTWIKNSLGHVEENLDKYPFPDRELYYAKYPLMAELAVKRIITSRGCPYKCSYCFEPTYFKMYKGKGPVVRRHSPDYVIEETRRLIKKYPTRRIHYCDDIFNLNKNWIREFTKKYGENFDLDFSCNIELTSIDEEIIKLLVDGGCRGGVFGLESGVERIRMDILNKKITDQHYIEMTNLLHKHNFQFIMNIMFCLPDESLEDTIESIRFATSLKPYGIRVSILKMYKGTELANYSLANGYSEGVGEFTYKAKDFHNSFRQISNVTWAMVLFQRFPFLLRYARVILSDGMGRLLSPIHLLIHWEDIKFFDIPLWQAWKYFWSSRDVFIGGMAKAQEDTYVTEDGKSVSSEEIFAANPLGILDWSGDKGGQKETYQPLEAVEAIEFSTMEPEIRDALSQVIHPTLGQDIVSLDLVSIGKMQNGGVTVVISCDAEEVRNMEGMRLKVEQAVHGVPGIFSVNVVLEASRVPAE